MLRRAQFDVAALYDALDAQRRSRGWTWSAVARAMGGISVSTLTGLPRRVAVEGDGVLQMLRWLDRAPESFVRGVAWGNEVRLPPVPPGEVLRFDAVAVYEALDAARAAHDWTWQQLAAAIGGVSAAMLTRLAKGGRVSVPAIIWIIGWLGHPVAEFTRASKD